MSKVKKHSKQNSATDLAPKNNEPKVESRQDDHHGGKSVGRRSLCTAAVQKVICDALEKSHTIKNACVLANISESTFYVWLARGVVGEEPYVQFMELVQYARARGMVALVESIITDKDWRAKAWYLERTRPEDFAQVAQRVIAPADGVKPWNGKGLRPYDPSVQPIIHGHEVR